MEKENTLLGIGLHVNLLQVEHYILKPILQSMGRCMTSYLSVLFFPGIPDHPHKPEPPKPDLPLTDLQFWNGFDTGLTVVEKNLIFNMDFEVMTRDSGIMKGTYLFTIDNYHAHRNEPDFYFAESPDEHKSHNIIELENGQIVCLSKQSLSYD